MLGMIKSLLLAVMSLWAAIPESVKDKAIDAAFSLVEQLVRAFFRSKQSESAGAHE